MLIFVQKLEPGVINKIKYRHSTAAKPYSILCPYVTFTHISYNIKLAMKKEREYQYSITESAHVTAISRWVVTAGESSSRLGVLLGLPPLS
jgi:hypothetical protein